MDLSHTNGPRHPTVSNPLYQQPYAHLPMAQQNQNAHQMQNSQRFPHPSSIKEQLMTDQQNAHHHQYQHQQLPQKQQMANSMIYNQTSHASQFQQQSALNYQHQYQTPQIPPPPMSQHMRQNNSYPPVQQQQSTQQLQSQRQNNLYPPVQQQQSTQQLQSQNPIPQQSMMNSVQHQHHQQQHIPQYQKQYPPPPSSSEKLINSDATFTSNHPSLPPHRFPMMPQMPHVSANSVNSANMTQHNNEPYYNGGDLPMGHQMDQLSHKMGGMSVQQNWSQLWNQEGVNLMSEKDIRTKAIIAEKHRDATSSKDEVTCSKDILRCTLTKVPDSASLLQKCRLPFGILIHPFKDDDEIPVIQDSPIVRCRSCRTYINPYVRLLDQRRWQCNLCHRVNDLPEEFMYDYNTRQMVDVSTRPELNYGSIEFIASVEYMVRPPQAAAYLFVFDCSRHSTQIGYIPILAKAILESLDDIPGDSRTLIGFIAFDSKLHFFNLADKQPIHLVMPDIHDVFLPFPDNLLVNLQSKRGQIEEFLTELLPTFPCDDPEDTVLDTGSALGPALSAAYKVIAPYGGRITLIQSTLPNVGGSNDGSVLTNREDPNNRTNSNNNANMTPLLNPGTDFYKKLALECSEHQIAVDLFNLSPSYSDLATVGSVSKFCGGSIHYYGGSSNPCNSILARFEEDMKHYLTRNIGFEAVMRMRCTRGLSIHTFHGNFFVRSTDLLALPNVNPDSGYAMQISIDDDLKDYNQVCFQSAILYTSSHGERRIRVHTLALPIVTVLTDVVNGADAESIVGMLSKMAVDRSLTSSITDAREALINAVIDVIATYRLISPAQTGGGLTIPHGTRLLPLFVLALLKHSAFRVGISTKLDDRVFSMERMKSLPLKQLMLYIYPNLYPIHNEFDSDNEQWPYPLQLSFANIERNGVYLLDSYDNLFIYICKSVHPQWLNDVFAVTQWAQIPDDGDIVSAPTSVNAPPKPTHVQQSNPMVSSHSVQQSPQQTREIVPLPIIENATSKRIRSFIDSLIDQRPFKPQFHILREDSRLRSSFLQHMYDDRNESAFSYYEFLQHLQQQLKN